MLQIQTTFLHYLKEVDNKINSITLSEQIKRTFNFKVLTETITDVELIIPTIGTFSAGKSSLLNSFLGDDYLPVGITPETALATELRYSTEEYIEAVKAEGTFEKYAITDIEAIKNKASQFKFLRMYINNENLKAIEPLILVDMPGFESPLDLHNQAILEYINKGVHYIVLTSVEEGTITRSMLRQLSEIQEFERDFSFFLSKANLRSQSEINEIRQTVKEQIDEHFNVSRDVLPIGNNGGDSLQKILTQIDPERLFKNLFMTILKEQYYTINEAINISISALGKSKDENNNAILELKQAIENLSKKRDGMLEEAKDRYSDIQINRIVESVGTELSNNVGEIVATAQRGGQDALSQAISEIVRHSLVRKLKESMSDISNEIVDKFSDNLSNINESMSDFTLSENWLDKMTETTKILCNSAQGGLNTIVNQRKNQEKSDIYKTVTTILLVITHFLVPIMEIIIIFLPQILSGFFKKQQQKKQAEQIRNTLLQQIIPAMKKELRTHLAKIFTKHVQEMIVGISHQFEGIIQEKQDIIASTQQDIENKIADTEQTIIQYQKVNDSITILANNTLFISQDSI